MSTINDQQKYPARHHFDCYVPDCKVCLGDHIALGNYIFAVSGVSRCYHDCLSDYRMWLDSHKIPAEGDDGWATREAWDQDNVHAFIQDQYQNAEATE